MKKILALVLAFVMLAATLATFASCSNDGDGDDTTTNNNNPGTNPDENFPGFTAVSDTVYVSAEGGLNVRKAPNAEDDTNKIGSLVYGKAVQRTGVNETTGWSRILYNGETAYVKTEYLSATEPPALSVQPTETDVPDSTFVACNEDVYVYPTHEDKYIATGEANYYSKANRNSQAGTLAAGTKLVRVGKTTEDAEGNGWSKLEYNGGYIYMRNSVLSLTDPTATDTTTAAN